MEGVARYVPGRYLLDGTVYKCSGEPDHTFPADVVDLAFCSQDSSYAYVTRTHVFLSSASLTQEVADRYEINGASTDFPLLVRKVQRRLPEYSSADVPESDVRESSALFRGSALFSGAATVRLLNSEHQFASDGSSALQLTDSGDLYFSAQLGAALRKAADRVTQIAFCGRYFARTKDKKLFSVDRFGEVVDLGIGDVEMLSGSTDGQRLVILMNDEFRSSSFVAPLDFRTVDGRVSAHNVRKIDADALGFTVYYRYGGVTRVWLAGADPEVQRIGGLGCKYPRFGLSPLGWGYVDARKRFWSVGVPESVKSVGARSRL